MSTLYQSSKDVPTEVLAARLNELADVVARKRDRIGDELTMRIPAECDRDADLVMSEAARRLSAVPDVQGESVGWQFYQHGEWWNGDHRIKDHRKNTEEAGFRVRDVYAAPQPAPTAVPSRDAIRATLMAHGFAVKIGHSDLKPYVYEAVEALFARPAPDVSGLVEALKWLRGAINCTPENDKHQSGAWISTKHPMIKKIDDLLSAHRKGGE